ncbi:FAD-dependent oxidoreductase [Mycolicibacterium peregrinum]|uniref:Pyridine nucleotide-disulfide oxidoreductase n=1 Tax=Mycolicibacterium peregrinum TaxID=43304 RepID=A0A4Z0HKU3_MYCPR|nr:FAD-dependent oxidoreductase [Mycolicibacterium peregrinum]TGB38832.1 pyridine nucleotide-disulfide oxidoreductase [Mycolicibacterium peregrinum]TGB42196.1 pyridine nucleotide-disulfide oxidoreductase [Mycolicibacterium peregrinum]
MERKRVVIAGLGDTGVLTAIRLARRFDVVGISVNPGLVSGQELGTRLARPEDWARNYWIGFDRFRELDRVRTVHGTLAGVDLSAGTVSLRDADGAEQVEPYDALVISTGVTNGFWRQAVLQSAGDVDTGLRAAHERLGSARSVAVIGGGAAAASSAANIAVRWPGIRVGLYYPGEHPLPQHHWRARKRVEGRLAAAGVTLHPGHRALVPEGFDCAAITSEPIHWSTGQPSVQADAVLWAIGRVRPNTDWLPADVLDERGFVRVTPELRVPGHDGVFAVGDVAATDPLRSSARNRADGLLARNVTAHFTGGSMRSYRPPSSRWGSVLGVQPDGLEVFAPNGFAFRFPSWSIERVLQPWIVRRGIYRGVRPGDQYIVTNG